MNDKFKSLLLVVDGHLQRTKDGKVWSDGIYNSIFFNRYTKFFDEVNVSIRIDEVDKKNEKYSILCNTEKVKFLEVTDFYGIKGFIKNYFNLNSTAKKQIEANTHLIIRTPSMLGNIYSKKAEQLNRKYFLEVVVDPWDFAAPGNLKTPFRPLIRLLWTNSLKKYCKSAEGVSYVTKYALQKRYPSKFRISKGKMGYETYYSSVNINNDFFMEPKSYITKDEYNIIHVANRINSFVKGHRESLEVVSNLNKLGYNVKISFVGDGDFINKFREYAKELNISNNVVFLGRISEKNKMRSFLRSGDIFLFPTYGEGLPRVLIESMAVGTPCVSSNVNGIPELLRDNQMAEISDTNELTKIVKRLIDNPKELTELSNYSIKKAKEYEESILQNRRDVFYEKLSNI